MNNLILISRLLLIIIKPSIIIIYKISPKILAICLIANIYYNVGTNGASFGVANYTYVKVGNLLAYFNSKCVRTGGTFTTLPTFVFYGNNSTSLLGGANNVFNGINNTGDII